MGKKLLLIFFLGFLSLTGISGFAQQCTAITNNSSISISTNDATNICAGESISFSSSLTSVDANGISYQWLKNGSPINGATNSSFSSSNFNNNDKIRLRISCNEDNSVTRLSNEISITVNQNRTGSAVIQASNSNICEGQNINFSISSSSNTGSSPVYDWQINGVSSGSGSSFSSANLADGDKVRLFVQPSTPCTPNFYSNEITISHKNPPPNQPGSITGNTSICPGTSHTYSINPVTNATSYEWSLPPGWSGSSSSTSIQLTAGNTSGTISVIAKNDCGNSQSQTLDINVEPAAPAQPQAIDGVAEVCPNTTETYSITAVPNAAEYIWSLPPGWGNDIITSETQISITTGDPGQNGNISVIARNSCGESTARNLAVTVKPAAPTTPGVISGSAEVCPGVAETYSVSSVPNATSYTWILPNGWTGNNSTTNSIQVTTGQTGTASLRVIAKNGCGDSQEQSLQITVKDGTPASAGTISIEYSNPNQVICPGDSLEFSVNGPNEATEYIWTLPSGWTISGDATGETIQVVAGTYGQNGAVKVAPKNSCGTGSESSLNVEINEPTPEIGSTIITGPARVCATATGLKYSIPAINHADSYSWSLPAGWTITSGANSNNITVSASTTSGNISVLALNECGQSNAISLAVQSIIGPPAQPNPITSNIQSNPNVCPPFAPVTFRVDPVPGADSYLWSLPNGFEVISGANTNEISVNISATGNYGSSRTVSVQAVNICGPGTARESFIINFDNYIVTDFGDDIRVCATRNQLTLNGFIKFGSSNLKPAFTHNGDGSFQTIPNNVNGPFTVRYTPGPNDITREFITLTVTVPKPNGQNTSCGDGMDSVNIYFAPNPTAQISASVEEICTGQASQIEFSGTPNTTVTYTINNGSDQSINLNDEGEAILNTGNLTGSTTYRLKSIRYTNDPGCSQSISGETSVIVNPVPDLDLSYAAGEFCADDSATKNPVFTNQVGNWQGGSFSASPAGLDINASNGIISPNSSDPGTYTVTYEIPASGGCQIVEISTQIQITEVPQVTFSYPDGPFCSINSNAITPQISGSGNFSGGSFSADSNLNINSSTGAIDPSNSSPGIYTITYTTPAAEGCGEYEFTAEVEITQIPSPEISYMISEICTSETIPQEVQLSGTGSIEGGVYSAAAGLSIDAATGEILASTSTPGTYTVRYSLEPAAGCQEVVAETEIIITQLPSVSISYDGPFCKSEASAQQVTFIDGLGNYEGGSFSASPAGLDIDPTTGAVNPAGSDAGDYLITYSILESAGCDLVETTTEITIHPIPEAEFSWNEAPFCNSDENSYAVDFGNTPAEYQGGSFSGSDGLAINSEGNIAPLNSLAGTHTVYYTIEAENSCEEIVLTSEIEILEKPTITSQPFNIGICSTQPSELSITAAGDNLSYQWYQRKPGETEFQAVANATSAVLSYNNTTSSNSGDYYVMVSGETSCEPAISETVSLIVDEEIIIEEPVTEVPICGDGFSEVSMKFIAHANGAPLTFSWYKDNIPVDDSDPNITITTGAPDQDGRYEGTLEIINITTDYNGDYYVEVQGPEEFTCSTAVTNPFQLRLNEVPEPPVVSEGIIFCQEDNPVALSEFVQGTNLSWYDSLEAEEPLNGAPLPGTETAGTFSWYVTQTPDVCESERIEVVVTIKEKPAPPIPVYSSIEYCSGEEANALEATALSGASLNWYADEALENVLEEAPTPDTQTATTLEYWVTQSLSGCQSDAEKVEVIIHQLPVVSVNASEELVCAGSTVTLTAEGAENYKWFNGEDEIGTGASFDVNPEITTTYTVFGTNQGDCSDSAEIIIEVDQPSVAGTISGETSVCISGNTGDIVLTDYLGEIIAWEFSENEGTTWTDLEIANPQATYTYENLTQRTGFRAIVQNGVCEPAYSQAVYIDVDSLPVAGELSFTDAGRLFTTCFDPDFLVDLNLIGADGQVYAWKYRRASQNTYTTITGETGEVLSASKIATLIGTETLIFQVDVVNGSCSSPVSSKTAILSLISSEIEPAPVTVSEDVICLDTQVTLSAETGYESGDGIGDSGNFDNASINQHGWRIINAQGNEENFETSANNTAPNVWRRVTPRAFTTASLTSPYTTSSQLFDHGLGDGNKGFALVSGQNTSKLETSLFTLDGMDEAILTFDQAYNLTPGASISVSIYSNGNWIQLYSNEGDPSSGNYTNFASGTPQSRPENKIEIDLGDYLGQSGLRIQFSFVGARPGDVWAIDNIVIPDGPQNVGVIWEDTTDAENPVIIGYNPSENWTPTEIGWNISVITTTLEYSNGSCTTAVHNEELKVFVFDTYSTEVIAETGSCGNYSAQLSARAFSETQGEITEYPTLDGYVGKWIIAGPGNFELVNTDSNDTSDPWYNPEVIFIADDFNEYSISWTLEPTARDENDNLIENPGCENIYEPVQVIFERCIALDFDGVDDYVDLGETYTGNYSIEAWILPFSRNIPEGGTTNASTGTIISGPNFEVSMNDLPAYVSPGSRWYHIAVSGGKLYVDGIEVGNFSGSGGSKTLIGARWNDTELQAENFFSGYIEEVRLWNSAISREQIRFLMNQRLQNAANIGVEIPMPAPGAGYAGLAGYYQLLADPALVGEGTTPDLAQNPVAGIVVNMETLQENTAPLPYTSAQNGIWGDKTTWTRPDVWDAPHSNGIDGSPIEWNIVRTAHDINSGGRDIRVLGLISENGKLDIFNPSGSHDETNPGQYLSISHYLNLNGIIDLTGESQLLQDVGSIVDSGSTGYLERDQQGTANSYNYNYWSFPVSVGGSNSGGSIRNLLKDGSNSSAPGEISFGGAHTHADNYDYSGQKRISAYWLFKFFGVANEYAEWHWVGADNSLLAGEGFTMKGTSGAVPLATRQNYVFRGLPNNGPLANISIGGNQNRLIGNPYPSALDAKQFILDNLNSANVPGATNNRNVFNGALYFWDHFGQENTHILREYVGGYATINLSGSVASATSSDERINDNNTTSSKKPGQFVPVGQGFFINTVLDPALANGITINGGDVVFSNSQRAFVTEANPNDSYFLKPIYPQKQQKAVTTKDNRYKIRLDFTSPLGYMRQILVTADANTTNGFDLGYDAPLIDNIPEDMYWLIQTGKFVIQGVPNFNPNQVLPLGLKIREAGKIKIEIGGLENLPDSHPVYLFDKEKDLVHDLRDSAYEIEIEPGEIEDRFEIVFSKKSPPVVTNPGTITPEILEGLGVRYDHSRRELMILNPHEIKITEVMLFDLVGKQIQNFVNIPLQKEVKLNVRPINSSVYIVKILTPGGSKNQKFLMK